MEHSRMYNTVKRYYGKGFYSKKDVSVFVGVDDGITADEYEQITGESLITTTA